MLPAGDDDSNADSDLVASLLLQRRRKLQHKSDVQILLQDAPCIAPPQYPKQLSAQDFEKQAYYRIIHRCACQLRVLSSSLSNVSCSLLIFAAAHTR
jgi:hypothetical protein